MRLLLAATLALWSGCSFYQPDLTECVLPCGEDAGVCPADMACVAGLCRAKGHTDACECIAGKTRPCGSNVGACKEGFQECTREGTWGACTGSIEPAEEICDGRDNDCDGRTDFTEAKLLLEDRLPFTTWETRLFGRTDGYALVAYAGTPDGGAGLVVSWYDTKFEPGGAPTVVYDGPWGRGYSIARNDYLVAFFNVGTEGVLVSGLPLTPGAAPAVLADLPTAGYERRGYVAITPQGFARVGFGTGTTARLMDVPLDGGAYAITDLPPLEDGGAIIDYAMSSEGRYSVVQYDGNPDGGDYLNYVQDNETQQILRAGFFGYDYPFRRGRAVLCERNGALPLVADWDDDDLGGSTRVSFTYDLLTDDDGIDVLPSGMNRWGENDTVLLPNGDLLFAISDFQRQAIVLASIHGESFANYETVLRNLPENSGFGPPAVALTNDEMVGLAWSTPRGVWARRVCVPAIRD